MQKLKGQHSVSHGFNKDAFEGIFIKMLDMVKIKNCWLILNYFGYDMNLKLKIDEKETQLSLQKYHTIIFSKYFEQFLTDTFNYYSSNKFWLIQKDLKQIFLTVNQEVLETFFDDFPFLHAPDIKLELEEWKLFWLYFLNASFKQALLISRYICWTKTVSQTIQIYDFQNPLTFYKQEAKNNFLKIVVFGKSNQEFKFLEKFGAN